MLGKVRYSSILFLKWYLQYFYRYEDSWFLLHVAFIVFFFYWNKYPSCIEHPCWIGNFPVRKSSREFPSINEPVMFHPNTKTVLRRTMEARTAETLWPLWSSSVVMSPLHIVIITNDCNTQVTPHIPWGFLFLIHMHKAFSLSWDCAVPLGQSGTVLHTYIAVYHLQGSEHNPHNPTAY